MVGTKRNIVNSQVLLLSADDVIEIEPNNMYVPQTQISNGSDRATPSRDGKENDDHGADNESDANSDKLQKRLSQFDEDEFVLFFLAAKERRESMVRIDLLSKVTNGSC